MLPRSWLEIQILSPSLDLLDEKLERLRVGEAVILVLTSPLGDSEAF